MDFHTAADSDDMTGEASKQFHRQEHGLDELFVTTRFA